MSLCLEPAMPFQIMEELYRTLHSWVAQALKKKKKKHHKPLATKQMKRASQDLGCSTSQVWRWGPSGGYGAYCIGSSPPTWRSTFSWGSCEVGVHFLIDLQLILTGSTTIPGGWHSQIFRIYLFASKQYIFFSVFK